MLGVDDRVELASGVAVRGERLEDDIRSESWPLNDTGRFVLERLERPLGAIAGELAARWSVDPARSRDDVLAFAWALNRALLANVRPGGRRGVAERVSLTLRLLPSGSLPARTVRRSPIDTETVGRAAVSALRSAASRALLLGGLVSAAGATAIGPLGAPALDAVLVGAASGAGVALHEAGHAMALRGVPAALVLAGHRTFVLHPPLPRGRRALVAVSGPGATAGVGCLVALVAALAAVPELAVAGVPLAAHAVGLGIAARDGRAACGL